MESSRNDPGMFQNILKNHFGFKTILKGQLLDLKTDFSMFQVHILDLNVHFWLSHSL